VHTPENTDVFQGRKDEILQPKMRLAKKFQKIPECAKTKETASTKNSSRKKNVEPSAKKKTSSPQKKKVVLPKIQVHPAKIIWMQLKVTTKMISGIFEGYDCLV